MKEASLQLFDPRLGQPALRVDPLSAADFQGPQRSNYFTILGVRGGRGRFGVDLASHPFEPGSLLFCSPYQAVWIEAAEPLAGVALRFHANFFCIEAYHDEVGCNGVLFHDGAGLPVVAMDAAFAREFDATVEAMRRELIAAGLAHGEALVAYLKILLIRATRLKLQQQRGVAEGGGREPRIIAALREMIERHYRQIRMPAEYAKRLHVSPKTLSKAVRTHLNTTPTQIIRERVMRQAKWELLHTRKLVKQVAGELGFDDAFHFSRLFKRATGCSPKFFREYETAIRSGRNLSM